MCDCKTDGVRVQSPIQPDVVTITASPANRMIDASREITFNLFTKQNVKVNILHSIRNLSFGFRNLSALQHRGDSCAAIDDRPLLATEMFIVFFVIFIRLRSN